MNRIGPAFLFCLLPVAAFCVPCESTKDGNWSDSSTWGGLPCVPDVMDTVTVSHTVAGDFVGTMRLGRLDIRTGGVLSMMPGMRIIQLNDSSKSMVLDGVFRPANGTEIQFNQASGVAQIRIGSEGSILSDNVNLGPLREVTGFFSTLASGICLFGENWTVTLDDATGIAVGDTAKFHPGGVNGRGGAEGMGYEVVALSGSDMTLCPAYPDSSSYGQRFTAHLAQNSTLITDGTAVTPAQLPAVGDKVLVFQPWWVKKIGAVDWTIVTASDGVKNPIEIVGADFSGSGALFFNCDRDQSHTILAHTNIHDGFNASRGLGFVSNQDGDGCFHVAATWNIFHDTSMNDHQIHLAIQDSDDGPADGGAFVGNTFYRTQHNNIQVNSSSLVNPVQRYSVEYNMAFDIGRSGSGECEFLEIDLSSETAVRFNVAWDLSVGCGCISIKASDDNVDNLYAYNYCQGAGRGGWQAPFDPGNWAINNYMEDCGNEPEAGFSRCYQGFGAAYNIARNCRNRTCYKVLIAEGNIADARGHSYNSIGFEFDDVTGPEARTKRIARNNVCLNIGQPNAACIKTQATPADGVDDFDCEFAHNTFIMGVTDAFGFWLRHSSLAETSCDLNDNICVGDSESSSQWCFASSAGANVVDSLTNGTHWNTKATTGVFSSKIGLNNRDPLLVSGIDWNLQSPSLEWTAGADPPGSPIGVRARHFDYSVFPAFIQAVMVNYPDITNEPAVDSDGDGWLSFLQDDPDSPDNCPLHANMDQADADSDGAGNVCDCSDLNPDVVDPVNQIRNVHFAGADSDRILWDADDQAENYFAYRGLIPAESNFSYSHICLDWEGTVLPEFWDPIEPTNVGDLIYYLFTGANPDCDESSVGASSQGSARPNQNSCLFP